MADYYYGPGFPYYIPAYNQNHNFTSDQPIHPNSAAAQLGLTPEELVPVLREQQCEYEYAQPLPVSAGPTIHPGSVAAQLGLTQEEIQEVLEDQEEWMREEKEQEQGEGGHTMAEETHQQQQG